MPGFPVFHYLPEFPQMSIELMMSSNRLILCHPTVSSSVTLFSCPQFFPASGSFPVSWLFASSGQRTGASASASVLPVNIKGWFHLGLTALIKHKISCVTIHWQRRLSAEELMLLHCGTGEGPWESIGQQGDSTSHIFRCSDDECICIYNCYIFLMNWLIIII